MNIFELSIGASCAPEQVVQAVSEALGVDASRVVSDQQYWDADDDAREDLVGIDIMESGGSFPVFVVGKCSADVYGEALGELAFKVSTQLDARVAVGDFINDIEMATGRFIIYFPDGSRRFAYECVNDGNVFDVDLVPE